MVEIQYSEFLVRCWSTPDGEVRLAIEHVQSGERVAVADVATATRWLASWAASPPRARGVDFARGTLPASLPTRLYTGREEAVVRDERGARR